ncbi:MAG: SIR2 family protein [Flavobacteriaceae bacterium]
MNVKEVKDIFSREENDMAFLIGNGINLYYEKENISWNNLLLDLWGQHSSNAQSSIPDGISFTEFFDALDIQNTHQDNFSSVLQRDVQQRMIQWSSQSSKNLILEKIKAIDAPILTTNFDDLIPKAMGLEFKRMENTSFTDYYPWSCYYSDKDLADPTKGFGVWYPNGMLKYHRSIKLGLSQYMGNVERARKIIHKQHEDIKFADENQKSWLGYKTWLHILFNKSIFIVGLSLDQTEVFIRWLLIERAKYFRSFPDRRQKGWFVMKRGENPETSEGKKFFLKSVGFEIIELDDYPEIYEGIWR